MGVALALSVLQISDASMPGRARAQMEHMEETRSAATGPMTGTARHPGSTPMTGRSFSKGLWSLMAHGAVTLDAREETGFRGGADFFHTGMFMGHARRPLGPGSFSLELMVSSEPLTGRQGYPLLLQTGETADGVNPLVDRQHPHDLLMALAASFRWEVEEGAFAFVYAAPAGSPALGPAAFMHRESGALNPVAPISHHFMDATHITYGVVTAGLATDILQLELSWFNGREPNESRWAPDAIRLDSFSGRITVTPGQAWSIQGSFGDLKEPEQLHPAIDVYRATMSVSHRAPLGGGSLASTIAWGRNTRQETTMSLGEARDRLPGPLFDHYVELGSLPPGADDSLLLLFERRVQSAFLAESTYRTGAASLFMRFEHASKDELFPPTDVRHSSFFAVKKVTLGGVVDMFDRWSSTVSIGLSGSAHLLPDALDPAYGERPLSGMGWLRLAF